jgi:hypothetical protein
VVSIIDIVRLEEQYAKIEPQVTVIETLLIGDDLGKIARHFRERHGSLAVRRRRVTLWLIERSVKSTMKLVTITIEPHPSHSGVFGRFI